MYNQKVSPESDVMTVEDFRNSCANDCLIDYDGYGHPVLNGYYNSDIVITPSRIGRIPSSATHIIWFNRWKFPCGADL